jgi:fumarate reductase flavoprotein subunit
MFDLGDLEDAGLVVQGDDVAAVADALGVDANALKDEAAAFNAFADGAGTDRFRTDPSQVNPITRAPIYALPLAITVAKGFGGVDVDLQGRVLDTSGQVIPGLYAAGELTGMAGGSLVGDAGFTGSLTAVVLGGRVAGENAAAE